MLDDDNPSFGSEPLQRPDTPLGADRPSQFGLADERSSNILEADFRRRGRSRDQTVSFMNNPSREEIDARLSLVEARGETRFAEISGKLDRVTDSIAHLGSGLKKDVEGLENALREVKNDNRNTRWTIVITVVASALAALGALWTTQGNLLSAFQARLAVQANPPADSSQTRPAAK